MMAAVNRGVLAIVSSPSGAGKTTLTQRLLKEFAPRLEFSVSYTTRNPRANEIDGQAYHFVTPEQFEEMVQKREFAEHAFVHGNRYGTAKAPVESALAASHDVIFDVDWQGGANLTAVWPDDVLKIFILPPDIESLRRRLEGRGTDKPEVIERRYRNAIEELEHFGEYEHLIINDDVDRAYTILRAIYLTRRDGTDPALRAIVEQNAASGVQEHAKRLIGR